MISGVAIWLSAPIALFIGAIGAFSVFKAVYVDQITNARFDGLCFQCELRSSWFTAL